MQWCRLKVGLKTAMKFESSFCVTDDV